MIVGIVGEWLCRILPIDGRKVRLQKGRTAQSLCGRRHEGVYKIGYESCHEIESLNVRTFF